MSERDPIYDMNLLKTAINEMNETNRKLVNEIRLLREALQINDGMQIEAPAYALSLSQYGGRILKSM